MGLAPTYNLVAHRTLRLPEGHLALLARQSTAWATVPAEQYDDLVGAFPWRGSEDLPASVQQLWDAGLLSSDGAPNPATVRAPARAPTSLLVKLTGACDYTCTYCYDFEPSRWSAKLQPAQIVEAIAGILRRSAGLSVVFHGGEPLLRFKTIAEVVTRVRSDWPDKAIRFAIQTNGSRLTPEIVEFLDANDFSVGLSLDAHTEAGNQHRTVRRGPSSLQRIETFLARFPDFVRRRCGVVAVVSKASAADLPAFALWLQERGISGLSLSFLDTEGRGDAMDDQKLSPEEAVAVYSDLVRLIRNRAIDGLAIRTLLSRMANLFTFTPTDFCHRGPCAAADEFLVLDAEGKKRSCDCVYDGYFELGSRETDEQAAREAIRHRHAWLEREGPSCAKCPLFGLCGGTCVAKAISVHGVPEAVDPVGCAVVRYFYPQLLAEFVQDGETPLLDYYRRHSRAMQDPIALAPI